MSKRDSLIHIAKISKTMRIKRIGSLTTLIVKTLEINLLHIDSESAESG
jgi:hypothetical protein